ncbi:MAG TPA: hypothetical protein VMU67_16510 [Steroidobacteraceae bacterium]|nr:hypothetical protein [Steroidobacteraceae bacterium]
MAELRTAMPDAGAHRAWAGHGSGARCDLCRAPIEAHQIEYEVESAGGDQPITLRLHIGCYHRWIGSASRVRSAIL